MYPTNELPEMFTLEEMAKWLRMNKETLRHHMQYGKLKCIRIGKVIRMSRTHIMQFLSDCESPNIKGFQIDEAISLDSKKGI